MGGEGRQWQRGSERHAKKGDRAGFKRRRRKRGGSGTLQVLQSPRSRGAGGRSQQAGCPPCTQSKDVYTRIVYILRRVCLRQGHLTRVFKHNRFYSSGFAFFLQYYRLVIKILYFFLNEYSSLQCNDFYLLIPLLIDRMTILSAKETFYAKSSDFHLFDQSLRYLLTQKKHLIPVE